MTRTPGAPARLALPARRAEVRLLLVCLAMTAALAAFVALMGEAREGDINRFDRDLLLMFRMPADASLAIGPRWLGESARDVTALGGFTVLALISVFAVILLVLMRRRLQAAVFGLTVAGAQAVSALLKLAVARPRPVLVSHFDIVYSSSFPSGHAMMSPVVYLTLAVIVAAGLERAPVRLTIMISATVLVVAIGISRVYLGVHWPTDVLAGWALGTAIATGASYGLWLSRPRQPALAALQPDSS